MLGRKTINSLVVVNTLTRLVYTSIAIRLTDNFRADLSRSVNRFHIKIRFSVQAMTRCENSPAQKATCLICAAHLTGGGWAVLSCFSLPSSVDSSLLPFVRPDGLAVEV